VLLEVLSVQEVLQEQVVLQTEQLVLMGRLEVLESQ
jgi:hypothetical protein